MNRVQAERRIHAALFEHLDGCLQRIFQGTREPLRFGDAERPGNLRPATENCILNDRRRLDFAVQNNRELAADIGAGNTPKERRALLVESQRNIRATQVVVGHIGPFNVFAGQTLFRLKFAEEMAGRGLAF